MIFNLTQHEATEEQVADGVVDPDEDVKKEIKNLLTFDDIPSDAEMQERSRKLAEITQASGYKTAMIGGASWFMSTLEKTLVDKGISFVYAFSKRVSVEETVNGEVIKRTKFKHIGFV